MDPNIPTQPPAPVEPVQPVQPLVPAMPPMESTPVPPPVKKTNWVLILGIVLLLVSVLALVGYFLYQNSQPRINVSSPLPSGASAELSTPVPTTDPTADWKTYTDSKNTFSFKYPQSWITTKYINTPFDALDTQVKAKTEPGINTAASIVNYTFVIADPVTTSNLQNWADTGFQTRNLTLEETKVGNLTVFVLKDAPSYDGGLEYYIVSPTKDKYIRLFLTPYSPTTPLPDQVNIVNTANQILSTFKFTEASSLPSATPLSSPSSTPLATPL